MPPYWSRDQKSVTRANPEPSQNARLTIADSNEFQYNMAILARYPKGAPMSDRWQLQEAKNRLSEVVRKARVDGPQIITVHGTDAVVMVCAEQYRKLSRHKGTLVEFFRRSPLVGIELELARTGDTGRDIEL